MNFWTALVVIAAIWGLVQVMSARHGRRRHRHADRGNDLAAPQPDPGTQRELEELRERVKVLEQITVDGREAKAIADEIERLRDR
ncbi:hypothetical protein [Pelagerythrobacter aerophilus]